MGQIYESVWTIRVLSDNPDYCKNPNWRFLYDDRKSGYVLIDISGEDRGPVENVEEKLTTYPENSKVWRKRHGQ